MTVSINNHKNKLDSTGRVLAYLHNKDIKSIDTSHINNGPLM